MYQFEMDEATGRQVVALVFTQIQRGEMFTAWDITRLAREGGTTVRHREAKAIVHALFGEGQMGPTYTRTLVRVSDDGEQALLYHDFRADPTLYGAAADMMQALLR